MITSRRVALALCLFVIAFSAFVSKSYWQLYFDSPLFLKVTGYAHPVLTLQGSAKGHFDPYCLMPFFDTAEPTGPAKAIVKICPNASDSQPFEVTVEGLAFPVKQQRDPLLFNFWGDEAHVHVQKGHDLTEGGKIPLERARFDHDDRTLYLDPQLSQLKVLISAIVFAIPAIIALLFVWRFQLWRVKNG